MGIFPHAPSPTTEVERLIAYGKCEVNELDRFGQTALHISAFEGHLECVELLLKKGSALSVQDKNGWTPLFCAARAGHLTICEKLLLEGADPSTQVTNIARIRTRMHTNLYVSHCCRMNPNQRLYTI